MPFPETLATPLRIEAYLPLGWSVVARQELLEHLEEPGWLTPEGLADRLGYHAAMVLSWIDQAQNSPDWHVQLNLRGVLDTLARELEWFRYEQETSERKVPRRACADWPGSAERDLPTAGDLFDFASSQGITKEDLARSLGWSYSAVRCWHEGKLKPSAPARESFRALLSGELEFVAALRPRRPYPGRTRKVRWPWTTQKEVVWLCENVESQSTLAEVLHVHYSTVTKWKNRVTTPSAPAQRGIRVLVDEVIAVKQGARPLPRPEEIHRPEAADPVCAQKETSETDTRPPWPKYLGPREKTLPALRFLVEHRKLGFEEIGDFLAVSPYTVAKWLNGLSMSRRSTSNLWRLIDLSHAAWLARGD